MTGFTQIAWERLPASSLQNSPELRGEWDRLNATRGDLPFLAAEAITLALNIFGTGNERMMVGRQRATIAAMFMVVPCGYLRWRTFQPSQIPLGAWVAEASLPLMDVAHSLGRGFLGFSLSFVVTPVDPLFVPRTECADDTAIDDYFETAWIDVNGNFEDYWNMRGKNLRQNMRKQRNRLASEGITGRVRSIVAPSEMFAAVERYGALESAGWKATRGSAIHCDNTQGSFYRSLLESAAQRGEAVIYEYLFGDRVVASNLCLKRNRTLFVLKTTYDESIQGYSPAFLLSQEVIQTLYQSNSILRIEYYGRVMDWHTKWTEKKRTLYHLTLYRAPLIKTAIDLYRHYFPPRARP